MMFDLVHLTNEIGLEIELKCVLVDELYEIWICNLTKYIFQMNNPLVVLI